MKSIEELRFAAQMRAKDYIEKPDNETQLNTIAEYPAQKTAFDNSIKKVVTARAINMASITSFAAAKEQTQIYMVDMIYSYQLRSAVKAHEEDKFALENSLSKPKKYITHGDDASIAVRAEEIKTIIKSNTGILTNILPADITKMEDAILAYNEILAAPKEAIDNRKSFGTDRINFLLNEVDVSKINIGKLIHSYFSDMAMGWDQAIIVGKSSGVRHTSIAIMFLVSGTTLKLKNVKCTITNGGETYVGKSSALGWVRFYSLKTDTWTATSELVTFETSVLSGIKVDDKHLEKHTVYLKKEP